MNNGIFVITREQSNQVSGHTEAMQWMDIKILDPEMEILMKELTEEQKRLKEALREKLKLMRYDTDALMRENQETRDRLRFRGVEFDDEKLSFVIPECDIKIKEEVIDVEPCSLESGGEVQDTDATGATLKVCEGRSISDKSENHAKRIVRKPRKQVFPLQPQQQPKKVNTELNKSRLIVQRKCKKASSGNYKGRNTLSISGKQKRPYTRKNSSRRK